MVVDSRYRGQGIGTSILTFIEDFGRAKDISGIGLLSGVKRESAHNFYQKNGYGFVSKWFAKKL